MTAKHQVVPVFKDHAALDMFAAILELANYFGPSVEMEVVEVAGNSSTELSWERPESNGANIDFYRVEQSRLTETNRTVAVSLVSSSDQRLVTLGNVRSVRALL